MSARKPSAKDLLGRGLTARVTIWMPPELDARLRALATREHCSKAELIRWYIGAALHDRRSRGVLVPDGSPASVSSPGRLRA